jgi:hypothetical protein
MLYYLQMLLSADRFTALPAAHAVLFTAWLCGILAVFCLARRACRSIPKWGGDAAGLAAAAAAFLYLLIPMGSQLAAEFFVEHFQALFHLCAALCAVAFVSDFKITVLFKANFRSNTTGWLRAAGLFAGLACGTKYLALLFTLGPLLLLLPALSARESWRSAVNTAAQLATPALVAFFPWLWRNYRASGDPLYPLGYVMERRAAGAHGLPDRIDHFDAAHCSGELSVSAALDALRQLFPSLRAETIQTDIESGPHLLFFTVPGLGCVVNAETLFLALLLILDLGLWFALTQRINRFAFPLLGPLAVLGGIGIARASLCASVRYVAMFFCALAVLSFAPMQLLWVWAYSSRETIGGKQTILAAAREEFDFKDGASWFDVWRKVAELKPGARALFVGEAQTFYCENAPAYSVVFNRSLLEEALTSTNDVEGAAKFLRERGITHMFVNYSEWWRLDWSYALATIPGSTRWERARFDEQTALGLQYALRAQRFRLYADHWPAGNYPAYLKLTPAQYERLETLFATRTKVVWPEQATPGAAYELRELLP